MLAASFDLLLNWHDCTVCGTTQLIDAPPCADGHGDQCPERACAGCGAAVFIDPELSSVVLVGAHAA